MKNLRLLIEHYCITYKDIEEKNLKAYQKTYKEKGMEYLLQRAIAGVTFDEKRDSHKYRIAKKSMRDLYRNLLPINEERFRTCTSFEDIFTIIYNQRSKGFNSLSVYDTACAIAVCFGMYPDYVYLHAGAKKGAINLLGIREYSEKVMIYNEDKEYPYIKHNDLPQELQGLEAYHIENFLCIYKDKLKNVK